MGVLITILGIFAIFKLVNLYEEGKEAGIVNKGA